MTPSLITDCIEHLLLPLHAWRAGYNEDRYGWGADELFADETTLKEYPHAYAVWGTGYAALYDLTRAASFRTHALACGHWLRRHPNPMHANLAWGLPLDFENTGRHYAYAITTLYVADLFFDLYRLSGDERWREALLSIRKWLLEDNGYTIDYRHSRGIWFHYSPNPEFTAAVYNVTAKAAGFFARLARLPDARRAEDDYFATGCIRYLLARQAPGGGWLYDDKGSKIDLIHTALTIDGLADFALSSRHLGVEVSAALYRSVRFAARHLITRSGFAYEGFPVLLAAPGALRNPQQPIIEMIKRGWFPRSRLETRTYGYAMALKAIAKARQAVPQLGPVNLGPLTRHMVRAHRTPEGTFRFSARCPHLYIRAQGHIFDGLAVYTACLAS